MGISFSFINPRAQGGLLFAVLDACNAEGIDLHQACNLTFNESTHELQSIGNITRGKLTPRPGLAGVGVWLGMAYSLLIFLVTIVFVFLEVVSRFENFYKSNHTVIKTLSYFKDPPDDDIYHRKRRKRYAAKFRASLRTFVLGASEAQTIFVAAFIISFCLQSKCQLTSYHFTVAVETMIVSLSTIVLSVALVRDYWREPLAASFRVLLSIGAFICVGMIMFQQNDYSPEWPPPDSRNDSVILLPVACLLDTSIWWRAKNQTEQNEADLGFQNSPEGCPPERILYIFLAFAFVIAHASVCVRRWKGRHGEGSRWYRPEAYGWLTLFYWLIVLAIPTTAFFWCWKHIGLARNWVNQSGWIEDPTGNPELNVWDPGQLIPVLGFIPVVMAVLTECKNRKNDADRRKYIRV